MPSPRGVGGASYFDANTVSASGALETFSERWKSRAAFSKRQHRLRPSLLSSCSCLRWPSFSCTPTDPTDLEAYWWQLRGPLLQQWPLVLLLRNSSSSCRAPSNPGCLSLLYLALGSTCIGTSISSLRSPEVQPPLRCAANFLSRKDFERV